MNDDLAVTTPESPERQHAGLPIRDGRDECDRSAAGTKRHGAKQGSKGTLADVIAHAIVPRLLLAHRHTHEPALEHARPGAKFSEDDQRAYAESALAVDAVPLTALTDRYIDDGASVEEVLLGLMVPAVRHFGVLWERDEITFVEVTVAVQRMQHVLRDVCGTHRTEAPVRRGRILLLPAPGEAHTFGLVMLGEMFRRRGWTVSGGLPLSEQELIETVSTQAYTLVGFSLSTQALIDRLTDAIKIVRRSTCHDDLKIAVGGRVFIEQPDLVTAVGADRAFTHADEVVDFAEGLAGSRAIWQPGIAPPWDDAT